MKKPKEIRLMTDTFRVYSAEKVPVYQIPPQRGFPTIQSKSDRIPVRNADGVEIGLLYPIFNRKCDAYSFSELEDDTPVCVVTTSNSRLSNIADMSKRKFPAESLQSFLCAVAYGVEVNGTCIEAMVKGPRIVDVSEPYTDNDGFRTVDLEIVEMYLSGYDKNGTLLTIRGGRRFNLPSLPGQVKAINKTSDFPASLFFDLTLEVGYWGEPML